MSDIALAAVTTKRPERLFSWKISDDNQKGETRVTVEAHSPDPDDARIVSAQYDVLRAKYPRENGNGGK